MINKSTTSEKLVGITSSPSTTTQISIDITDSKSSLLGKMVYLEMEEEKEEIIALGQITFVETKNRWYEDPTFKGIIKQHGRLPNLSERADTRLASLNVQSCFIKQESSKVPKGHVLGISPSTGLKIKKMDDAFMRELVKGYGGAIQYIGTVYGSKEVNMPMWFRHFGTAKGDHTGAGDALHIGVFGKTGSGKTVLSSLMMISYAKSKKMNLLVFDPQGQFYQDTDLLPDGQKLEDAVKKIEGSKYKKYKLPQDIPKDDKDDFEYISLPKDGFELFGSLLLESDYIRQAFNLTTPEKKKRYERSYCKLFKISKIKRSKSRRF